VTPPEIRELLTRICELEEQVTTLAAEVKRARSAETDAWERGYDTGYEEARRRNGYQ
jgi:hypothetical protein